MYIYPTNSTDRIGREARPPASLAPAETQAAPRAWQEDMHVIPAPFEVGTLLLAQAAMPFGHWSVCSLLLFTWKRLLAFVKSLFYPRVF